LPSSPPQITGTGTTTSTTTTTWVEKVN
jgi:hypothetical protein